MTECRIIAIQECAVRLYDEELGACAVRIRRSRHGDGSSYMRDVILHTVTGKFSLDRLICTAGSIALRITALHHETIYDTPESQSVIESVLCKLHEVCHCDRSCVCIQFYLDASIILDIDPCMMDSCQFLAGI